MIAVSSKVAKTAKLKGILFDFTSRFTQTIPPYC
jgi:hypothetical protein